jgi:hypothetical protein
MAYPHQLIPQMEGLVGTLTAGTTKLTTQAVVEFVEECKRIMHMPQYRGLSDWEFYLSSDVDETANDIETGGHLYGILAGNNSSDASADIIVAHDDADGTYALDATAAYGATFLAGFITPVATTDGTEEYAGATWAGGIAFTNHLCIGADGLDGTNPAANDVRAWILYRTA